jgi:hypothetical protein
LKRGEHDLNKWKIYFVGLASAFSDCATSWICERYYRPELVERNPLANPFLEAAYVLGGQVLILGLGEKWKVNPKFRNAVAIAPTMLPFAAAINNIAHMAIVDAKRYPWTECPLLYPE